MLRRKLSDPYFPVFSGCCAESCLIPSFSYFLTPIFSIFSSWIRLEDDWAWGSSDPSDKSQCSRIAHHHTGSHRRGSPSLFAQPSCADTGHKRHRRDLRPGLLGAGCKGPHTCPRGCSPRPCWKHCGAPVPETYDGSVDWLPIMAVIFVTQPPEQRASFCIGRRCKSLQAHILPSHTDSHHPDSR